MKLSNLIIAALFPAILAGCGSAYSGLTHQSQIGAQQYMPAVYVEPGNEAKYNQVLAICRQVAANRQATAAQTAQLKTITGVGSNALEGAALGGVIGHAAPGADTMEGLAYGAAAGLVIGLAEAFREGAEGTAEKTREALLNCLRVTGKDGELWTVVE